MKAKLVIVISFIAVFGLGLYIGAMSIRLQAYARAGAVGHQGDELLRKIRDYKTHHGEFPDQDWFEELGDKRITSERRVWTYYAPPRKSFDGKLILISVPIDRSNYYFYGYNEGYIQGSTYDVLISSEQVGAPNPLPAE